MAHYTEQDRQVIKDALNNENYNAEVAQKRAALQSLFDRTGRMPTIEEMMMSPEELGRITE
jgi:hypothetical protein